MKKTFYALIAVFTAVFCFSCKGNGESATPQSEPAQSTEQSIELSGQTLYVYAKSGLNLREAPSSNAAVIAQSPYGAALALIKSEAAPVSMSFDGLNGFWINVQYDGKTGFAFDGLLGKRPAPQKNEAYTEYIHRVYGPVQEKIVHRAVQNPGVADEEDTWKEEYKLSNGAHHLAAGYYAGSFHTYTLPDTGIQEAFLAAKLAGLDYLELISSFPRENKRVENREDPMASYTISVDSTGGEVRSFKVEYEYWETTFTAKDGGVVVESGGGT